MFPDVSCFTVASPGSARPTTAGDRVTDISRVPCSFHLWGRTSRGADLHGPRKGNGAPRAAVAAFSCGLRAPPTSQHGPLARGRAAAEAKAACARVRWAFAVRRSFGAQGAGPFCGGAASLSCESPQQGALPTTTPWWSASSPWETPSAGCAAGAPNAAIAQAQTRNSGRNSTRSATPCTWRSPGPSAWCFYVVAAVHPPSAAPPSPSVCLPPFPAAA